MKTYFNYKFLIWDTYICIEDLGDHILVHTPYAHTDKNETTTFKGHQKHRVNTPIRMAVLRRMAEDENLHLYSEQRDADLGWEEVTYLDESENWGMCEEIANRIGEWA